MPHIIRDTSILSLALTAAIAGSAMAQQSLPQIPVPVIEADDLGIRVFNIREFLQQQSPNRAIDASYTQAQAFSAPRSLEEIDFVVRDQAAGIICEASLQSDPIVTCGVSSDPLSQFRGGEVINAEAYFDELNHTTELGLFLPGTQSQDVDETIEVTKGPITVSLQRTWNFAHDDVTVCLEGQVSVEGYEMPLAEIDKTCNEDIPASDYLGDLFIQYEQEVGPIVFPDLYKTGPGQF